MKIIILIAVLFLTGCEQNKTMTEQEKRLGENVIHLQRMNPNHSTCHKCGLPWNECKPKSIQYTEHEGVFAMCTYCWDNSTVDERVHHFRSLWMDHKNRWGYSYDFTLVENEIIKQSAK